MASFHCRECSAHLISAFVRATLARRVRRDEMVLADLPQPEVLIFSHRSSFDHQWKRASFDLFHRKT